MGRIVPAEKQVVIGIYRAMRRYRVVQARADNCGITIDVDPGDGKGPAGLAGERGGDNTAVVEKLVSPGSRGVQGEQPAECRPVIVENARPQKTAHGVGGRAIDEQVDGVGVFFGEAVLLHSDVFQSGERLQIHHATIDVAARFQIRGVVVVVVIGGGRAIDSGKIDVTPGVVGVVSVGSDAS